MEPIFIDEKVDLKYEVAAILQKLDGTPVYYPKYRIIGNIYSSIELFANSVGLKDFLEWIPFFLNARHNFGKLVEMKNTPIMKKISIKDLPILTHYEKDAGKYITSAAIVATWEEKTNVSTHRILLLNEAEATLRIVRRHLYTLFADAKDHGEDLPIAVCIGVPPSVQIAAATSLDPLENELKFAAALEGGVLPTIGGLPDSEIIIKGKLLHDKLVEEGPFYDIAEKYDIIRKEPLLQINEILAKENFVYHALLPAGKDHKFLMGLPRIPVIFDEVKKLGVDVKEVFLSSEGFGWLKTIISIKKKSEDDIKKVLEGTIKAHYSTKIIIVVDEDIDVTNYSEVQNAIILRSKFDNNNPIILTNVKGSSLDPRAEGDLGSKMLIDATKPPKFRKESYEQGKIPFDETKFKKFKLSRGKLD